MNSAIWIILFFIVGAFLVAIIGNTRKNKQVEGWAIANRGFGSILVFILMGGELYTTFTFLGGSSLAYNQGGICYYIICYAPIAYILGYWLAPAIWKYARQMNLISQSDFFIAKYDSKPLGILVSIVGILALIPYLLLQIKGLGIIVSETSYGLISANTAIWLSSAILVIYVVISGIHGSVRVALIKDIMIIITVVFLGIYLPFHYYGGIHQVFLQVEQVKPYFTIISGQGFNAVWFISTVLLSSLGLYMWPHGFSSLYTAKSTKVLRKNAVLMPLYQIILIFVLVIGFVAVLQLPNLNKAQSDLVLLRLVISNFNPWVVGFIGAAGMLTALVPSSIILLSTSTLLIKNIYKVLVPFSTIQEIKLVKWAVPLIMLITLWVNHMGGRTLVSLLVIAYGLVTQLFPPLVCSLMNKNPVNKYGATGGILTGVALVLYSVFGTVKLVNYFPASLKQISIGIVALVFNIMVMLILSVLSRLISRLNFNDKLSNH